ncbi:MAG: sterol desaturase family protein [Gammaproteobacteria bacterium]
MLDLLLNEDASVRLGVFIVVFAVLALWEWLAPRRLNTYPKNVRWLNNVTISLINVIVIRLIIPVTLVFVAVKAELLNIGLLNLFDLPGLVEVFVALLILDFAIYIQHIIFHKVGFLWRLHRVHHADLDFDLTTGIRFHPVEILLSLAIKMLVVLAIGAPYISVLVFEMVLNATSLFNHANIRIPLMVDKVLRWFVVTPDMHRVHHSIIKEETNSNFGFNLPWWDYMFNTYQSQPHAGHDNMEIGIESFRKLRELWLDRLLLQPFRKSD